MKRPNRNIEIAVTSLALTSIVTYFLSSNFDLVRGSVVMYTGAAFVVLGSVTFVNSARAALASFFQVKEVEQPKRSSRFEARMKTGATVIGYSARITHEHGVILYEDAVEHYIRFEDVSHFVHVKADGDIKMSPDEFVLYVRGQ